MAAFNSTTTFTDDQLNAAPPMEPAFEHLLWDATVHESVIGTLRVNAVTDRETFVNMYYAEAALKEGASDLGFNLATGGLPHKREFARVLEDRESDGGDQAPDGRSRSCSWRSSHAPPQ